MGFGFVNGQMLSKTSHDHSWSSSFDFGTPTAPTKSGLSPQSLINSDPSPLSSSHSIPDPTLKPTLTIHPTPLKSRVETQIPIKLTLFPMPPGVTKLHLPTYTISKPKLLAKPPLDRSPDTLELYTTLVCTSAMQNPEYRRQAFARAGRAPQPQSSQPSDSTDMTSDEDEESKPIYGGEVRICPGCIVRERKRAARKKVKKFEEEESWHKDEKRRVIVFNTHEIKEWQPPSSLMLSENIGDSLEPVVPEGAMQIDAPMRIACYCRHQNEKLGFQVIFTIKDYNDNVIAQEMSSSIMITDDHKTHSLPSLSTQASISSEGQLFTGPCFYSSESNFDLPLTPFRQSRSSPDLPGLQRDFLNSYIPSGGNIFSAHSSQSAASSASATMAPRNLSRQASPSGTAGPNAKKRKPSSCGKIPSGLTMTRLETNQLTGPPGATPASTTSTTATTPSSFATSMGAFQSPQDKLITHLPQTIPSIPQQYSTGPPTPSSKESAFLSNANRSQSMENLSMRHFYSAPASAHQSRAPSPNGLRNNTQNYQQAQIAQAVANTLYSMPLSLNPHRSPTIHKMIPNEGPKSGGIEVTCLGSGFYQGLEVMFGDVKATTTTYWGETSLVCLLPPSPFADSVSVTFQHQYQQQQIQPYPTSPAPKQQIFFKYFDDDEQQLIRTALSVLGHKMTVKWIDGLRGKDGASDAELPFTSTGREVREA
jgi:hypothetical protein